MKTKKLLSLLLALMMMLSVVPFYASAADPIALTEANVTVWPTVNGEISYGQKLSDGISLSGGEVQYNGTVVDGHFEFIDSDIYPTSGGINIAALKFIPENFDSYTGFEIEYAWDVLYNVNPVTPVLVDENAPPVATEVEAGARLSTSTISGAAIKNPITNEIITDVVWNWESSRTKVNESGYYPARATVPSSNGGYNPLTVNIYVRIAGDIPETAIAEYPTVPELTYNPNVTWADIELTGGKAVIKGTETEVEGTFAIKNLTAVPNAKSTELTIVFTPANAEAALPYEFKIPVKVNPCPISFGEDHKGTAIDEPFEVEVAYGSKVSEVLFQAKKHLNYPTPSVVMIEDANSLAENGKVYKVTVLNYTNTNYTGSEAFIKTVIKAATVPMEIRTSGEGANNYYIGTTDYNSPRPQGTYNIYVDGELYLENSPDNFVFAPEKSGEYTVKVVYNPTENDYCIVEDIEKVIKVTYKRTLNRINTISDGGLLVSYGDTVEVTENLGENFGGWKITDANGNEVDLGVDTSGVKITFTMPDYDITVEAKAKSGSGSTDGGFDLDDIFGNLGDLTEGDSDNPIVNIFNNIIAFFKNIITTITNLFRAIGDAS